MHLVINYCIITAVAALIKNNLMLRTIFLGIKPVVTEVLV